MRAAAGGPLRALQAAGSGAAAQAEMCACRKRRFLASSDAPPVTTDDHELLQEKKTPCALVRAGFRTALLVNAAVFKFLLSRISWYSTVILFKSCNFYNMEKLL